MSFLNVAININDLPDSDNSMEPVPAGVYQVVIDGAELKTTKAGTGQYINLKLKIQGGQFSNRVFFDIINISNPSEVAQNIGLATLKKIMKSMGLDSVQNTDQLIGGHLTVKVDIERSEQYGDKNKVKDYQSIGGSAPVINSGIPQYQPQPPTYTQASAQLQQATFNPDEDLPF